MLLLSFGLVLFELALTRLFGVVLFASSAHLALALALLGISLGAVLQHLWPWLVPEQGLERRLGWLSLLQGLATALATWACVSFPVTVQFDEPPATFGERSTVAWDLVDPLWFALLMPILAVPFTVTGLVFAGAFQRRKAHIGLIYGADLIGGALGALLFIPLLKTFPAADVAWAVLLATAGSALALFLHDRRGISLAVAGGICALAVALLAGSFSGLELFKIRYAAGYSEENVTYTRWTPLTRLAVHEDERGTFMLLDNTSASEVILTIPRRDFMARRAARAFVYHLHEPPARVAILAASAGPEVAAAQRLGYHQIDAIDIAAEIGEVVATRWPNSLVNPYLGEGTRRIWSDGRAAIMHAEQPYDIIQMVHANLHSSAGMLANAWSPNLLETVEAFHTYLDKLNPDGTLSFAASSQTRHFARAAARALEERGAKHPGDHILYVTGNETFMLVKKRPWKVVERNRAVELLKNWSGKQGVGLDPTARTQQERRDKLLRRGAIMTDNRPYFESPGQFWRSLKKVVAKLDGEGDEKAKPIDIVYNNLALQTLFVLLSGSLLVLIPLLRRGPVGLKGVRGVGWGLLYVCGLGYGYLAIETVLIHELVLYVGHPTYAVTAVIFSMLLFSGLGSIAVGRFPAAALTRCLRVVLGLVLLLGALQAWVVPPLLHQLALGLPMTLRIALTALALAPLGFVMGMPFPSALRILRPEAAGMVPWAWAFNGWTSVLASLATVYASRLMGYDLAFAIALVAYAMALFLAGRLERIGEPG